VAQQAITAAQAKANQYLAAMKEATNAWNRAEAVFKAGQFNPALAEITAALGCCTTARPLGDAGEVGRLEARLKERQAEFQKQSLQAERVRDYGSATNYFAQGRYDEAATLCQRHNGDAEFDALAKQNSVEKSALDSGNQKFADCDYAFVQEWKNLPYSQKQPFVDLINQAIAEAGALQQLIEWQTTTNWIAMKSKLAEPASATFKNKKRFAELDRWALKQQQILDARFEYRLIQFGIIKSDEAKNLASGDVRNAEKARITTDFSLDQKEAYLGEVRQYEDVFRRAGLLNQDDRSRRIQRLRDNINRR
jgi:hypothetical protein